MWAGPSGVGTQAGVWGDWCCSGDGGLLRFGIQAMCSNRVLSRLLGWSICAAFVFLTEIAEDTEGKASESGCLVSRLGSNVVICNFPSRVRPVLAGDCRLCRSTNPEVLDRNKPPLANGQPHVASFVSRPVIVEYGLRPNDCHATSTWGGACACPRLRLPDFGKIIWHLFLAFRPVDDGIAEA